MMTRLIDFLCRCSGIREDALRLAPSGRIVASTQGLLLLAVASFSSVAAAYALHRVFVTSSFSWVAAAILGPLWGVFIFALDRSLALSFDPGAAPWSRAAAAALRLALAAVVAMAISTPLILRVAEPVLEADLRQRQRERIKAETKQNADAAGLPGYQDELERLQTGVAEQRDRLRGTPDTTVYRLAVTASDRAEQRYDTVAASNNSRIAAARRELAALAAVEELTDAQLAARRSLQAGIRSWQADIGSAAAARQNARDDVARIQREWLADEAIRLKEMEKAIGPMQAAVRTATDTVEHLKPESEDRWTELTQPTLINQYGALRRITRDKAHPDRAALVQVETVLHLLWFLVEAAVLLMKISWPKGELDAAVETLTRMNKQRIEDRATVCEAIDREWLGAWHALERRAKTRWSGQHMTAMRSISLDLSTQLKKVRGEFDAFVLAHEARDSTAKPNVVH